MKTAPERYFIKADGYPWKEVTEDEWVAKERAAGFRPTGPWKKATAGFSGNGWQGIYTLPSNHAQYRKHQPDLPA